MGVVMATSIRPLVERILGGRLTDVLVGLRAEGMSHERIARHLGTVHDIQVSGEQVRVWCRESDVDTKARTANKAAS